MKGCTENIINISVKRKEKIEKEKKRKWTKKMIINGKLNTCK